MGSADFSSKSSATENAVILIVCVSITQFSIMIFASPAEEISPDGQD